MEHKVLCIAKGEYKSLQLGRVYTVVQVRKESNYGPILVQLKEVPEREFEYKKHFVSESLALR